MLLKFNFRSGYLSRDVAKAVMVPDHVIFANSGGTKYTYGDIRSQSDDEKLRSLELRLTGWLIDQVAPLGDKTIYSPFPLCVMTCVAIESTSHIFLRCEVASDDGRKLFGKYLLLMDSSFKPPMQKGFIKKMRTQWPNMDFSQCKSVPDILYKTFRNSLTHAYRSYGVYITEHNTKSWDYGDGFLHLNPYWFWDAFQSLFASLFQSAQSSKGPNPRRDCCLQCLQEMLA